MKRSQREGDREREGSLVHEAIYPDLTCISKYGNQYIKNTAVKITNPFWKNVLKDLSEFSENYAFSSLLEVEACSFLFN